MSRDFESYESMIHSMGVDILYSDTVGSYQGEYYMVVKRGDRFGFLNFGYGSCSHCDPLQRLEGSENELREMRDDMFKSIIWFSTVDKLGEYVINHEKEWYDFDAKSFVSAVKKEAGTPHA